MKEEFWSIVSCPRGTRTVSGETVSRYWLTHLAVMPSLLEHGRLGWLGRCAIDLDLIGQASVRDSGVWVDRLGRHRYLREDALVVLKMVRHVAPHAVLVHVTCVTAKEAEYKIQRSLESTESARDAEMAADASEALRKEKQAHQLEKEAHERTWNTKKKIIEDRDRLRVLVRDLVHAMTVWGSWEDGVPSAIESGEYGEVGKAFNRAEDYLREL